MAVGNCCLVFAMKEKRRSSYGHLAGTSATGERRPAGEEDDETDKGALQLSWGEPNPPQSGGCEVVHLDKPYRPQVVHCHLV